jgi:hypothetical protein
MDPTSFAGFAILVVVAGITGVIGYLAVQQGKLKRQIEQSRLQREREELAALTGVDPSVLPTGLQSGAPPVITPGGTTPGTISGDAPRIEPGGTPHHPHSPHDGGGAHGGFDGGGSAGTGGHH